MQKIESKISYLSNLFNLIKMTFGQRKAAKSVMEELINHINYNEVMIDKMKARLSNADDYPEYLNALEITVMILQCLGFDLLDTQQYDKQALKFILLNKGSIEKEQSLTIDRFKKYMSLIEYFKRMNDRYPQTLNELTNEFNRAKEQN